MLSGSIEEAREEVLQIIENYLFNAKAGIDVLAEKYCTGGEESGVLFRPAMLSLIFDSTKTKMQRCTIISAIGKAGEVEDAHGFLRLLLENGLVRNRAAYRPGEQEAYGDLSYQAEPDKTVRVGTLLAIESIMGRHTKEKTKLASADMGRALVKCALLDDSEQVRISAARVLGNFGDRDTLKLMVRVMLEAESEKNNLFLRLRRKAQTERHAEVYGNGMEAVHTITENMKEGGVKGSAVSSFLHLAEGGRRTWKFASDRIMEACRDSEHRKEVLDTALRKAVRWKSTKDRGTVRKVKRLCTRMQKEGFMNPPAKMRRSEAGAGARA